jgi:hypothetical protein
LITCSVDPIAHRRVYKPVHLGFHPGKSGGSVVAEACSSFTPAQAAWVWRHIVQVAAGVAPQARTAQDHGKAPLRAP